MAVVNKNECVGCGTCTMGICPVDAISFVDGKANIDKIKCIQCGTCVAVCPIKAIKK